MISLTLPGRPITKKNHQQIIKRGKRHMIVQSEVYQQYEQECLWRLKAYKGPRFDPGVKVRLTARYWMPNRRSWPDLLGLLQATCDILESAGIIKNDRDVVSLDGSRIMGVDKENPRAEIRIKEI